MKARKHAQDQIQLAKSIRIARGLEKADCVIKNGTFLDVFSGNFIKGDIALQGSLIVGVEEEYSGKTYFDAEGAYIVPGFIDAHVHIESSLMTPARFQQAVLPRGTCSVIWDPHEIANVWGNEGIKWALESSEGLTLDFYVMLPSCVPATSKHLNLESSGAHLNAADLLAFKNHPRVLGLAEMMNYPGLLGEDREVLEKLSAFADKFIDGHCPMLSGKDLNAYIMTGIHSCHESTNLLEAKEKLRKGIKVLIREGSCARDAKALLPLLNAYASCQIGFCSDDRNPLDIENAGHIDAIIDQALKQGLPPEVVFRSASYSSAMAYGLRDRGAIAPGFLADFVFVEAKQNTQSRTNELQNSNWTAGLKIKNVFKNGLEINLDSLEATAKKRNFLKTKKNINLGKIAINDHIDLKVFEINCLSHEEQSVHIIKVKPGQILTEHLIEPMQPVDGLLLCDLERDFLKISVLERHHQSAQLANAFANGFGLKNGAIATSINHDSHNIIVVGSHDDLMVKAVNVLIACDGGIVVVHSDGRIAKIALPIGGLMTDAHPASISAQLKQLKDLAHAAGCLLDEPFLQLSFLALPVIPDLKISDQGLIDVLKFEKIPLFSSKHKQLDKIEP
ncbi:MAG: adenine deaminase [Oligoflexales bacterium]|nr:adenine deaminase [Oligoflexales bacterium]